jgi:hypothetical protein
MAEPLTITLRYRGRDVDDGTMPVDDVVDALQGFAGAYSKVAAQVDPSHLHQIKVTAIKQHSFDVLLLAGMFAADKIKDLGTIVDAGKVVVRTIMDVINLKNHTKGKPYDVSVSGNNNTVVVLNAEKIELSVPVQSLELFREKLIDGDLNKIASPLHEDRIEEARLIAEEGKPDQMESSILSSDREYFRPDSAMFQIRELELVGTFVSLNKESNRGTFKLTGGNVQYRYMGEHPVDLFHAEFARKGPVRVQCKAEFDQNGVIQRIDIISVHSLQAELDF